MNAAIPRGKEKKQKKASASCQIFSNIQESGKMEQGDRNSNVARCNCTANCNCKSKDPSTFIRKIITLIEHQVTKNDIERQKEMIKEFVRISENGFFVKNLYHVMRLIELLLERIDEIFDYVELLEEILEICFIPPLLTLSSEVLTFVKDLEEYFSMLGYLLVCLKQENLHNLVAGALITLLKKDLPEQRWYLPLRFRKKSAESSRLPEILGQLLEIVNENMYTKILQIITLMVKESPETCKVLLYQDALNSLFTRLEPTWKERYPDTKPPKQSTDNISHYEESLIIIWTLLQHLTKHRSEMDGVKDITLFSLWNLQYIYRLFILNRHKSLERNIVLAIIVRLLDLFPKMEFVKSGLAEDIYMITLPSLQTKVWAPNVQVSLTDDDYTYMQLLLTCATYYVNFPGGIRVSEDLKMVYRLLKLSRNIHVVEWPQTQLCVISILILEALGTIVPYSEEEFIEHAGPNKFLSILQKYQTSEHDMNVLSKCLQILNNILRNSSTAILNSVLYHNGFNSILDLCDNLISDSIEGNLKQKCLGFAFCILNTLLKHSTENSIRAVDITIKYMRQMLHPNSKEPVQDNRVIVLMMDFVWEYIIKDKERSAEFVKRDGAFLMLDIIENFPFIVQLVTLGALVDLCEYGNCIPYLITWRGKGQKIIPLLMNLFREENKKLNVKSGPRGQISDIKYPLMGKEQWINTFCRCIETSGNPVMCDLFVSCRPKIYALLQMLNERYKKEIEIADECYKCYNDELTAEDQVTLLLAENFLALKLGEAWVELKTELDKLPATLTSADDKIISALIDRAKKWALHLQKAQNIILETAYQKEVVENQKLYNFLEQARLSDALNALMELRYIARCSERLFRVSQKFLHNHQIESSLLSHSGDTRPHRTFFSEIHVTPVFNQTVNVESKINKTTEEIEIIPVSPTVSNEECNIDLSEDLMSASDIN